MTTHRRAVLRIYGPDIQQDTVEVTQTAPLTVGRLDDNDLALRHTKVSRNHARFVFDGEKLTVEDLGSSNGTLKGDQNLPANQPTSIGIGESVSIGPFSFFFDHVEEGPAKPQVVPPPPVATPATLDATGKQPTAPRASAAKPPASETPVAAQAVPQQVQQPMQEHPIQPNIAAAVQPPYQPPAGPPIIQTPPTPPSTTANGISNGVPKHLGDTTAEASTWMQYLPEIYSESDFFKRFLLIFETGFAPYKWIVDNMDLYFDAKMAPPEWLQWFGKWVDVVIPSNIPEERQHLLVQEMGWIFKARGTRKSLARHLELVFGTRPDILEPSDRFMTFIVRLPIGRAQDTAQNRDIATQIIESHRPIHTRYQLIIE